MPLAVPCACPSTALKTHGTKKSNLTQGCGEMDGGLSISVSVEEHPPSAASQELSRLESLQDVRLKADAPGTKREANDYITT